MSFSPLVQAPRRSRPWLSRFTFSSRFTQSELPVSGFSGYSRFTISSPRSDIVSAPWVISSVLQSPAETPFWESGQRMRIENGNLRDFMIDAGIAQLYNVELFAETTLSVVILAGYTVQVYVEANPSQIVRFTPTIVWMNGNFPPLGVTSRLYTFTCHKLGVIIGNWGEV
jgi:hypothetical protein